MKLIRREVKAISSPSFANAKVTVREVKISKDLGFPRKAKGYALVMNSKVWTPPPSADEADWTTY